MIISYKNNGGERLDKFLTGRFLDYSRSYFQKLINNKKVLVNKLLAKPNQILKNGDKIQINFIKINNDIKIKPADIKLDIIFENNDVIIVNKPAGMVVHPAAGNLNNTLVNALVNYLPSIKLAVNDEKSAIARARPGIVHRLDKDTTGVLIVAKNTDALKIISKQILNRKVKKLYLAICLGWPKNDKGTITNYLGRNPKNRKLITDIGIEKGKEAISNYHVKKYFQKFETKLSLIEFDIKTGRTHQIRYQAKSIGVPVLGDQIYGTKESINAIKKFKIKRQLLHAKEINFVLPYCDKSSHFVSPLPADFLNILG